MGYDNMNDYPSSTIQPLWGGLYYILHFDPNAEHESNYLYTKKAAISSFLTPVNSTYCSSPD